MPLGAQFDSIFMVFITVRIWNGKKEQLNIQSTIVVEATLTLHYLSRDGDKRQGIVRCGRVGMEMLEQRRYGTRYQKHEK